MNNYFNEIAIRIPTPSTHIFTDSLMNNTIMTTITKTSTTAMSATHGINKIRLQLIDTYITGFDLIHEYYIKKKI